MTPCIDDLRFVEGQIYSRGADIHDRFGGSRQREIAPSAVFIFTGDEGEQFGYVDRWDQAEQAYTYIAEDETIPPMTSWNCPMPRWSDSSKSPIGSRRTDLWHY